VGRAKTAKYSGDPKQVWTVRQAAILLKHASDPTRLRIISMLTDREMYVGEVCLALHLGQPAVSHHLALLRHGGIIVPRRQGQNTFYSLTEKGDLLAGIAKGVTG